MANLELKLLGDIRVLRDGQEQNLPPSKKTRALLAYLAMSGKAHRREHLCELLWEMPDDPRGSLRWSLSKIRRLVDDDETTRIQADRSNVDLDSSSLSIDSKQLNLLANGNLAESTLADLQHAAEEFNGEFLAGLELANFHEFSSWCLAHREQAERDRVSLLCELLRRKEVGIEEALNYNRSLVSIRPYDKNYRIAFIKRLLELGRNKEAEQQVELGTKLLKEVGEEAIDLRHALKATGKKAEPPESAQVEKTAEITEVTAPNATALPTIPLVGRDSELTLIRESFQQVVQNPIARCLLFRGEPGIGKSSLLNHALALAVENSAAVLKAGAFESEIVRPFALWNDALRESFPSDAAELLSGDEQIDRDRLFESIARLISGLTSKQPVLILFDDIQWCDESSAAALHYVLRMNTRQPLWVVLGAREEELQVNFPVLSALRGLRQEKLLDSQLLEPLNAADISHLIEQEAPDIDIETITEKSQGNPFLALELAKAVAAGDVLGTLNELIGERLARMAGDSVTMLNWAAVLAPNISIGALLRYSRLEDEVLDQALEEAERFGLLLPTENGYQFSHDLVTRSIYRSITPARRRNMHRRVAELLEADTAMDLKLASELARHAANSGDVPLAARSMLQAARLCLRFYANDDAFNLAERGLGYTPELSEVDKVCLQIDLKEVQMMSAPIADWQAAADDYIHLAEQALDLGESEAARTGYHMASSVRWSHGHIAGARKTIMQAERVSRGGSESSHIVGMAEAARCLLLLERDLPEADAMIMEASARAERNRVDSDALPAAKGMMCYYENKLDEAEEHLDEARTRSKALGDRLNEFQANEYLAMIEIERGDFRSAQRRCRVLTEIGGKLRAGSEAPFAKTLCGICDYATGGNGDGIDEGVEGLRRYDAKYRLTYALNRAAMLDLENQQFEKAKERAREALGNAQIMDRTSEILTALTILAESHKALGERDELQAQVNALLALPKTEGAQWARVRAEKIIAATHEGAAIS